MFLPSINKKCATKALKKFQTTRGHTRQRILHALHLIMGLLVIVPTTYIVGYIWLLWFGNIRHGDKPHHCIIGHLADTRRNTVQSV